MPRFEPIRQDLEADVCIVGAGIAGLTTALLVARDGHSAIVVDDGPIAGGETARTTAHLASVLDDGFREIERLHGERGVALAYRSQAAAIDAIERIVVEESIDCDFERLSGNLFLGDGQSESLLDEEYDAARRAGCGDVERLGGLVVDGRDLGPCLRFPRQAQLHPLRYCAGLARAANRHGAKIFEAAHAESIEKTCVRLHGGRAIRADHVVVATNTPFNDRVIMHTKQAAYRTYAIGAELWGPGVTKALYWDTEDPYHYVRVHEEGDRRLLIVGGEDHKTGQGEGTDDGDVRLALLESWARERFRSIGAVVHRWSGQIMEPVDGVAFIGRNSLDAANVYVATGDSGMGMTHGTIAGMLIADLVAGRENEWAALYDPSRKTLRAAGRWLAENLNVATKLASLVTPGEVSAIADIPRGEGAVLRRGLAKIAVYRAADGSVHQRSAICPHLGCVVAWNATEKSWDCPCHGSRFDPQGRVLNGPSASDLAAVD